MKKAVMFLFMLFSLSLIASNLKAIEIETVPVENPGLGGIEYLFYIGRTEVTVEQYVHFLNSVAADDLNDLYNSNMGGPNGGILETKHQVTNTKRLKLDGSKGW